MSHSQRIVPADYGITFAEEHLVAAERSVLAGIPRPDAKPRRRKKRIRPKKRKAAPVGERWYRQNDLSEPEYIPPRRKRVTPDDAVLYYSSRTPR